MAKAFTPSISWLFNSYKVVNLSTITKIPIATLKRYKQRGSVPTTKRFNQLRNTYRSVQYTRLRAAGAATRQADRFKGGSVLKIDDTIRKYQRSALMLALNYDVDEADIIWGMTHSTKGAEEIFESV